MSNSRLIQSLVGLIGALVGVLICALAGIDFSASSKETAIQEQAQSNSTTPTNITSLSSKDIELSQLRFQLQLLKGQLGSCRGESSQLRMDALTNQMNQQRR